MEGVLSTERCYTVIVSLLNFVTRCLSTSWDENNCPLNAMETVGEDQEVPSPILILGLLHHLSVRGDSAPSAGSLLRAS